MTSAAPKTRPLISGETTIAELQALLQERGVTRLRLEFLHRDWSGVMETFAHARVKAVADGVESAVDAGSLANRYNLLEALDRALFALPRVEAAS